MVLVSEDDCRNISSFYLRIFGFAEDNWSAQSCNVPALAVSPAPFRSDPFRLWGDDFRAGSILLSETDETAALIDWEYRNVRNAAEDLSPHYEESRSRPRRSQSFTGIVFYVYVRKLGDGVLEEDVWKTRVQLLSEEERAAMDPFVKRKMAELKKRRIVKRDPAEARQRFLFRDLIWLRIELDQSASA
ncbi:hypothetical protein LY76DRAFT_618722 [Colletotrichum caudatum]|nr:hypothetical protein LY76DRAFT_618722 [Colletotrichum caudatum]